MLLIQVSATTSKQDSLQAFPKKAKRKSEELIEQFLKKIDPARGDHKSSKPSELSCSTVHEGKNQKAAKRRVDRPGSEDTGVMIRGHSFPRQNLTNSAANLVNSAAHRGKADKIPRLTAGRAYTVKFPRLD